MRCRARTTARMRASSAKGSRPSQPIASDSTSAGMASRTASQSRSGANEATVSSGPGGASERSANRRQAFQPLAHGGEALELSGREPKSLAGVIPEPREAENLLAAAPQERARQASEHGPAPRLLRREAAEVAVEHERGVVVPEAAAAGFRRDEHLGWDDVAAHGANNRRNSLLCQAPCFLAPRGFPLDPRTRS